MTDTPDRLPAKNRRVRRPGKYKSVFTTGDIADICQVASRTVSKWFDSGKLEGFRIPGSMDRRVTRHSLLKFLREHKIPVDHLKAEYWNAVLLVGLDPPTVPRVTFFLQEKGLPLVRSAPTALDAAFAPGEAHPTTAAIDMSAHHAAQLALSLERKGCLCLALANEDDADPEALLSGGFRAYLRKPCDPEAVAVELERLTKTR